MNKPSLTSVKSFLQSITFAIAVALPIFVSTILMPVNSARATATAQDQSDAATASDPLIDSSASHENSINEQTIYIPYEELKKVFERDGRGVFLPYEKFQQLWKEARANQAVPPDTSPPLGALITDIESVATLGKEVVNVDAKIAIELLRKGWHRVPLRLAGSAIRSATISGEPARIVSTHDNQYELLITHADDLPKTIHLEISYAKSLSKSGGQSVVAFQAPQAPVNRWTIRTGQTGIDVQIEPMIASSKRDIDPTEDSENSENQDSENGDVPPSNASVPAVDTTAGEEILAFVGAAPEVRLLWTPKSEGASGLSALISAETQSRFQIDQGVARTTAMVLLDISRAEISAVSLTLPADQKVVNVFDRNIKKWDVITAENDQEEKSQTIEIQWFEPAIGKQSFSVELEKFVEEIDNSTISVPQIAVNEVSRNSGVVAVNLAAGLRAEPEKKTGLLQIDAGELPAALKNGTEEFAYRYSSLPFELTLNMKKIQPQINVDQLVEIELAPEKIRVELSAIYDIQLTGVFQVFLDIPPEYKIREIRSLSREGLNNVPIDTFYRDAASPQRVIVTLAKKAIGKMGLLVSLDRELNDANLLNPTDIAAEIEIPIPKTSVEDVEFSQGNVVVYAPENLQVNVNETKGLRNESFQNVFAKHVSSLQASDVRPILAFGFSHTDATLDLQAKRRRPQVTIEQVMTVSVQSGVVKYDARLFGEILYSGVKSLRLDVPTRLVGELRNRSTNILQQTLDPQPADVPDGYTAWELTGDNEFFGKHEIHYSWEQKFSDLLLGESKTFSVDRLIPADVDRSSGQIVLTKSETIDVRPESDASGLRPIDPQTDLSNDISVRNASLAFGFADAWSLNLKATRFELQDLKRTSVSRALVRVVALRQGELSVQCLYQMRSVGQRISLQMPTGFDPTTSFDDQPIRINGRRVTPERGGKDLIYIPLTEQNSGEPFLLEVRYTISGTPQTVDLPYFTAEPAVQKVYLCVYLPYEQALFSQSGPWTDEAIDDHTTTIAALLHSSHSQSLTNRMFHRRHENVDQLVAWVTAGVNYEAGASQKFEVDGRPYVFSALQPEPAPAGSLHLKTINMTLLNGVICGLIGLLGLLLARATLTKQLAGVTIAIAVLMVVGIFFPLVTEHLFSETLLLTATAVGFLWVVLNTSRWFREVRRQRLDHRSAPLISAELAIENGIVASDELTPADESRPDHSKNDEGGVQ